MPDVDVAITAGSGTNIRCFQKAGGDYDQYVREARVTAVGALNTWTASTTAATSQVAADVNRVALLITSQATGTVYLRFDSTAPTSAAFHWYLNPGDRYEVPLQWCQLAVSMVASTGGGTVLSVPGTCS